MSFSLKLKQEILENKSSRVRAKRAQGYGLFLFSRAFSLQSVAMHSENAEIIELFKWFARDVLGKDTEFTVRTQRRGVNTFQTIHIASAEDRERLLEHYGHIPEQGINMENITLPDQLGAFLAGVYLACGSVSDPKRSYHLEFSVREEESCQSLFNLLEKYLPGAGLTQRRKNQIIYYKECAAIQDIMTLMGAPVSCLALIDIEMIKSVRNHANRATNCETANIDKMVGASTSVIEDIKLIYEIDGEDSLTEPLRQVARLRMEYPESSLRELVELSPENISRSGLHHRLDKLRKIAETIRERELTVIPKSERGVR